MEYYLFIYKSILFFTFSNFMEFVNGDPCSENRYTIIDDHRRSPSFRSNPSERRLCDNRIDQGWYRFKINGTDAEIPTTCVPHGCGTRAPLWLTPPANGLPPPGKKTRSQACASFEVAGRDLNCCGLKFPITIKNCGNFFVYRLRSTKGCDLAYCAEAVTRVCEVGQVYVLHLQKCIDIVVEISKPKLHVKRYPDRISVVCLFDVYNITVAEHKPTFSVTWIKVRNGVSKVIRFKFLSDTRDQVVLGKDVFTGDSVACEVMPVHQSSSQVVSELLFLGIQVMETDLVLQENGRPGTITFVSTVPLVCQNQDKKCKLDMVLTVKYPKGNELSNILLSRCLLEFRPDDKCQGIGCISQQVHMTMTPNLYSLKVKDIYISGYLYVDEQVMWNQDSVQTKIKVIDLPTASCFVTAGVFILSFQNSISKIARRGTYVMLKTIKNEFEIQVRINSCGKENLLCVCGVAVYYRETRLTIDACRSVDRDGDIIIQYYPSVRTKIKIFEGRHGKLIYVILDSKSQVRIDLRQTSMSVTVQASGYFTNKADGLCSHIGNGTSSHDNEIDTSQPFVDWRLLPGLSMFENFELLSTTKTLAYPECDCSRSSYETSCPLSSATVPEFLFHLKETTFYWLNRTQSTNQIPDYMFEGDFDNEEILTKQPAKDGQLANDICTKMFMTSGIAKTCLNKININIETVINICIAMATSYENSTWIPEILRLLENLCETHLSKDINSTKNEGLNDVNIEDIRQAILCPEGCYGNGICTENGCFCYHGYTGIECLTKIDITSTTTSTTSTTTKPPTTTTTMPPTTTTPPPTTTTVPSTTTTPPPTTTTVPSTAITPSTTTTVPSTTSSTTRTSTTTTVSTTTTTAAPLSLTTCDTRSTRCSTVYIDLSKSSGEFALKCYITLMQFTFQGWEPVGTVYTTLLRYVDKSTVECMLPMVTNGDNFVNVYRVQVPDGGDNMLRTQLLAVVDDLCQICDVDGGCILKPNTCFIEKRCYRDGETSPKDVCLQCLTTNSKSSWSPLKENLPPVLEPDHSIMTVVNGDTVKTNITATDPENMELHYSTVGDTMLGEFVNTLGEFTWDVDLSLTGQTKQEYRFVINVTDSCGASSTFTLMVAVNDCACENGGACENKVVNNNHTEYNCSCLPSFTGKLCETRINGCHSNPCYPGVKCTEMSDSYRCENCLDGYQGDGITSSGH